MVNETKKSQLFFSRILIVNCLKRPNKSNFLIALLAFSFTDVENLDKIFNGDFSSSAIVSFYKFLDYKICNKYWN